MSNKAFGDPWIPWGSNMEVTGFLVAIWVGPQIKAFFRKFFDFFLFVKWGPSKSGLNPKNFWFWRGVTLGPLRPPPPPPWANPRYVPELASK